MKNDIKAVSPVIGVILMVAITVVLAAAVFVFVSHFTASPKQLNHVEFTSNTATTTTLTFTVLNVDDNLVYSQLSVKDGLGNAVTFTHSGTSTSIVAGDVVTLTGLTTNTAYSFNFLYANQIVTAASGHTV